MNTKSKPDWSSLPNDILGCIGNDLLMRHSLVDLLRFRAVCHSFRCSAPCPKPSIHNSAFRILFSKPSTPGHNGNFFLVESTVYAIQPLEKISNIRKRIPTWLIQPIEKIFNTRKRTPTWLLKLEHSNSSRKLRIKKPILENCFRNSSNELPKSVNLLDCRVKETAKTYRLEFADNPDLHYFRKVVVSPDGFEIMAITRDFEAFLWRNGDEQWIELGSKRLYFKDIVYYNHKFYALNSEVTLVADSKSLSITKVEQKATKCSDFDYNWRLVKSFKDLFLIVNYQKLVPVINHYVKVYKLDEEKSEWVEETNALEERAFIVGGHSSFSFSSQIFKGFDPVQKGVLRFLTCKSCYTQRNSFTILSIREEYTNLTHINLNFFSN